MAVTITSAKKAQKQKQKEAPKVEVSLNTLDGLQEVPLNELVDLYGRFNDEVTALELHPAFHNFKKVSEELKLRLNTVFDLGDSGSLQGKHYDLQFGASGKKARVIEDKAKVLELLGPDAFVALAKIGITDAQKYLTGEQLSAVCSEPELSGVRKISVAYKG